MKDTMIMQIIKSMFNLEINNNFFFNNNNLVVILKDGTVAKISAKKLGTF